MGILDNRLPTWEKTLRDGLATELKDKCKILCFEQVNSTMDVAREIILELNPDTFALVLAETQLQGRGRQGREWESAAKGFFATYVFNCQQRLNSLSGFSLMVGVVLQKLFSTLGAEVRLKWPNDILSLQGNKLSGILIEIVSQNETNYILCGIGVNLLSKSSKFETSVSLSELCARVYSALEFAALLSPRLYIGYKDFQEHGFLHFKRDWLMNALYLGAQMEIDQGARICKGVFEGIGDNGNLLLRTESAQEEISSGHIIRISQNANCI